MKTPGKNKINSSYNHKSKHIREIISSNSICRNYFYRYSQYSKLKRVKSYGDGIYGGQNKASSFCDEIQRNAMNPTLSSNCFCNGSSMHLSCLSCQNQFAEECNRTTHQISSIPAGDNLNFETEEPSSISMLIWDQNQKSACPTYESVPVVNNGSKMTTNNGNSP